MMRFVVITRLNHPHEHKEQRVCSEPQAKIIGQLVSKDSANDGISAIGFDTQDYVKDRIGAHLKGAYQVGKVPVAPYVRTNLWRSFGGSDATRFDGVKAINTDHSARTMDVGVGVIARLSASVSIYASTDYSANIDSRNQEAISGSPSVRMSW